LAIIAIAWLFYRPLIGIPLLLVSVAGIWFLSKKAKNRKAAAAAAGGTAPAGAPASVPASAAPQGEWTCACGKVNKGKFCDDCGKPRPAGDTV